MSLGDKKGENYHEKYEKKDSGFCAFDNADVIFDTRNEFDCACRAYRGITHNHHGNG